jgi:HEAT repeat protein
VGTPDRVEDNWLSLLRAATVIVRSEQTGRPPSLGTGFFIAPHLVVTCAHVVRAPTSQVSIDKGKGEIKVSIDFINPPDPESSRYGGLVDFPDLAVLAVPDEAISQHCVLIGDESLKPGDRLQGWAMTTRPKLGLSDVEMAYSGMTHSGESKQYPRLEGVGSRGMSGTALADARQGVVVAFAKVAMRPNRVWAIPLSALPTYVLAANKAFHRDNTLWMSKTILGRYLNWRKVSSEHLSTSGTPGPALPLSVKLDEVYVSGRAVALGADVGNAPDTSAAQSTVPIPLVRAARDEDSLVVLGGPGSGKTAFVNHLALRHTNALIRGIDHTPDDGLIRLPIMIRAAEYGRDTTNIRSFLMDSLRSAGCPLSSEDIKTLLGDRLDDETHRDGPCVFLFDGLDEVIEDNLRKKLSAEIVTFTDWAIDRGHRVIVTSRLAGYERSAWALPQPFTHYAVVGLSRAEARKLLDRWCPAIEAALAPDDAQATWLRVGRSQAEDILAAIESSGSLIKLGTVPLLLRMMALLFRFRHFLPTRRSQLFEMTCHVLLHEWHEATAAPMTLLPESLINECLELLAGAGLETGASSLTKVQAEELALPLLTRSSAIAKTQPEGIQQDPSRFIERVGRETGLIHINALGLVEFAHASFHSYYQAKALLKSCTDIVSWVSARRNSPQWHETIRFVTGIDSADLGKPHNLLQAAVWPGPEPSPYEDILHRDFLLFLDCLGDQPELDRAAATRVTNEVTTALLDPSRQIPRGYRWALLARIGILAARDDVPIIRHLIRSLSDKKPETRRMAAVCLGATRRASAPTARALVAALGDSQPQVVSAARWALRSAALDASPSGVAVLTRAAQESVDRQRRMAVIRALASCSAGSLERVEAIAPALKSRDPDLRATAAWALSSAGQGVPAAIGYLSSVLHEDKVAQVRGAAAGALGMAAAGSRDGVEALISARHDQHDRVRLAIVQALGEIAGDIEHRVIPLAELLADKEPDVRENTRGALAAAAKRSSGAAHRLVHLIRAGAPARSDLVLAVGSAVPYNAEAVGMLVSALHDDDARVCAAAAQGLGIPGWAAPSDVVKGLTDAIKAPSPSVRIAAIDALAQLAARVTMTAVEAMQATLSDPDANVRAHGASALGGSWSDHTKCGEVLDQALHDPDPGVRVAAAFALERTHSDPLPSLRSALSDANTAVRAAAIHALSALAQGDEAVQLDIAKMLTDPDNGVAVSAASVLGTVGEIGSPIVPLLQEALRSRDVGVRCKSVIAIAYAEPAIAIALLGGLLEDDHPRVRAAAVYGLAAAASRISAEPGVMIHEVLKSLTVALEDANPKVAKAAAQSLSRLLQDHGDLDTSSEFADLWRRISCHPDKELLIPLGSASARLQKKVAAFLEHEYALDALWALLGRSQVPLSGFVQW